MRSLVSAACFFIVIPAYGSIILFSGVTVISPPPSVQLGQLQSDTTAYVFAEQQDVLLTAPQYAGITMPGTWDCCTGFVVGAIPAGTTVNSYYLRSAPTDGSGVIDFTGSITFSAGEKILGIIVGYQTLATTDSLFGSPITTYPNPSQSLNGLDTGDVVTLSSNFETVNFDFHTGGGGMDSIRILTETPEPAGFILLGSGLLAVSCKRRSLRATRNSHSGS